MNLSNKRVAILATDGFEQSELFEPKRALEDEGATVHIISDKTGSIKGWNKSNWGESVNVDKQLSATDCKDYNALVLPGGVMNPDTLRTDDEAIGFIRGFFDQGKPVAAICHAPQMLINADVVKNRKVTSYKSIKKDLTNAGATWVDEAVVCDQGLVTSRTPDDLPQFNRKMIEEIKEGKHDGQVLNA